MAMQRDIGSGEVSGEGSDADSISITSTVLSEQKNEYPVEAILAEERFKGVTKYLVKWEGYPEFRCTWETRSMFQEGEDSTFHAWETQKMRVARGMSKPFDVGAFKKRVETWLEGIENRKLRRRAKMERMGLPVSPSKIVGEVASSDSEAEEEEEPTVIQKRLSSKPKSTSASKSPDESHESEAVYTESSEEDTTTTRRWTSQEESALLRGLELCNGPNWSRILSVHNELLKGFSTRDLKDQARRIKSSFRQSGKEIPQYLNAVSNKQSNREGEEKVQGRKSITPRRHSIGEKRDRRSGTESDDSLVEELRMKDEAKKKKRMQKPDTAKKLRSVRNEGGRKSTSREGTWSESASTKPLDSYKLEEKPKIREKTTSSLASAMPSATPRSENSTKPKNESVAVQRDKQQTTKGVSGSGMIQGTRSASHSSFVAARAPTVGAQGAEPHKPPPQSQTQMGAVGRGPRRVASNNVFLPAKKKKKNFATGAAVLSNWNAAKQPSGRSGPAMKATEAVEKPKKYNSYSIINRNVKKSRNEPAPNMGKSFWAPDCHRSIVREVHSREIHFSAQCLLKVGLLTPSPSIEDLQLLDPKDGKAVKAIARANSAPTNTKSALELLQERVAQEKQVTTETADDPTVENMEWVDAIEAGIDESSDGRRRPMEPSGLPEPTKVTQAAQKGTIAAEPQLKKKSTLTLQAYSQRNQADSPASAALQGSPIGQTSANVPGVLQPASFRPFTLPKSSTEASQRAISQPSGISTPPNRFTSPVQVQSPDPHSLPPGNTEQSGFSSPDLVPPANVVSPPVKVPTQGIPFTSRTPMAPGVDPYIYSHEIHDIYGTLLKGPERTSLGDVRFRSLDLWSRQQLLANKTGQRENLFWLSHMCTAADYESHFHPHLPETPWPSGFIVPYSNNLTAINDVAESLRLNASGAVCSGKNFAILVYPARSEEWTFMDRTLPSVHPSTTLRCIIRKPMVDFSDETNDQTMKMKLRREKRGKQITFVNGESPINAMMRNVYDIDYQRIIRQQLPEKTQSGNKFFLIFPKERKAEQDLIVQFLDANGASEIYAYNEDKEDGTWDYFCRTVSEGVIIAHFTFWKFHHLPRFSRPLAGGNINIWSLSLRKSHTMSDPHLIRLFPHGCMLLITDSLLLLQPVETLRILAWFRLKVLHDKPHGTWKVITRPKIRRFLTHCCRERKLDEEGKRFVKIYEQISYMLDPEDWYDWEEDEPKEDAPIYCMQKIKSFNTKVGRRVDYDKNLDLGAIERNDNVLADFFAGWANVHVEDYRRFHIISGFSMGGGKQQRDRWVEKWSYCEVFTPAEFYKRHRVPSQADLDQDHLKKHKEIMQMLEYHEQLTEEYTQAEEAEQKARMAQLEDRWKMQLDKNPKLKETYEGLMTSGAMDTLPNLGEEAMNASKEEGDDGDDDWSNDGTSVSDVEMGEVVEGHTDQDMVDVQNDQDSEPEHWSVSDSEEEWSSSGSED